MRLSYSTLYLLSEFGDTRADFLYWEWRGTSMQVWSLNGHLTVWSGSAGGR